MAWKTLPLGARVPSTFSVTYKKCVRSEKIISGSGSDYSGIPDLDLDPFPDPGQNQIFKEHKIKKKFTHHSEVLRIGLLYRYCFHKLLMRQNVGITFGNLYYFTINKHCY